MKEKIIEVSEFFVYWYLIIFPFTIAIAPAFTTIAISFLFTFYFLKKFLKKEAFYAKSPIDAPFLLLVIVSAVSMLNTIDYTASIRGIFKLVQNALIYLIFIESMKDRLHAKRIVVSVILGASLASFDAVWQVVFGHDFIRWHEPILNIGLLRATAAFPHANVLGVYLSPLAPLAFGIARYYAKGKMRLVAWALAILTATGLVLTLSRPAGLAFFIGLVIIAIVKKDRIVVWSLLLLLAIAPFIAPKSIKEWARSVHYNPVIFMCNYDRMSIYRNAVNMIKHHPWIGVGVNTFSKNYVTYKLPEPENAKTGVVYAHNNFLHMAGEIGLLGLAAFLWLLARLFKACVKNYKSAKDADLKLLALLLTVSLCAFLINGLTETSLYYSRVAVLFWYLAGFALAIGKAGL